MIRTTAQTVDHVYADLDSTPSLPSGVARAVAEKKRSS